MAGTATNDSPAPSAFFHAYIALDKLVRARAVMRSFDVFERSADPALQPEIADLAAFIAGHARSIAADLEFSLRMVADNEGQEAAE